MYVCMYVYLYLSLSLYIYIHIHMYVYVCMYIYIYIYIQFFQEPPRHQAFRESVFPWALEENVTRLFR